MNFRRGRGRADASLMEDNVSRLLFAVMVLAAWFGIALAPAAAQDTYPSKPIKIVLPVPPGSALDIATRAIADQLTSRWGQQVLIEARPGAGGLIAGQAVASSPADGYTLLGGPASLFTILPAQKDKLPIDVNRSFVQLGMVVGSGVMFIAVTPKLGVATFAELVALAKSKPGQIAIGTNGAGTLPHFAGLVLEKKGNVPITVVPYNQGGTMAAISDIMGGRVHGTIEAVFGLRGPLQSGDIKLVGQMASQREPEYPDVPTVAETLPGISAIGFMTLAAPAGTPPAILSRLADGFVKRWIRQQSSNATPTSACRSEIIPRSRPQRSSRTSRRFGGHWFGSSRRPRRGISESVAAATADRPWPRG
jgi:tripartite-type tricarboxylate transporter receptor subunit TctC